MLDDCTRLVHEDALRIPAGQPNAKIRLLATERPGPDPAEIGGEASRFEEGIPAKGHVGPHQIADGGDLAGHAAVGAADDPVELRREPGRAAGFPLRKDLPSHPDDSGVLVVVAQAGQPGWVGLSIVVEEGDDAAPSRSNTGVSGIGQTRLAAIRDDRELSTILDSGRRAQLLAGAAHQGRAVIDDHDDLRRPKALAGRGPDGPDQQMPSSLGVGADDHGYGANESPAQLSRGGAVAGWRGGQLAGVGSGDGAMGAIVTRASGRHGRAIWTPNKRTDRSWRRGAPAATARAASRRSGQGGWHA